MNERLGGGGGDADHVEGALELHPLHAVDLLQLRVDLLQNEPLRIDLRLNLHCPSDTLSGLQGEGEGGEEEGTFFSSPLAKEILYWFASMRWTKMAGRSPPTAT